MGRTPTGDLWVYPASGAADGRSGQVGTGRDTSTRYRLRRLRHDGIDDVMGPIVPGACGSIRAPSTAAGDPVGRRDRWGHLCRSQRRTAATSTRASTPGSSAGRCPTSRRPPRVALGTFPSPRGDRRVDTPSSAETVVTAHPVPVRPRHGHPGPTDAAAEPDRAQPRDAELVEMSSGSEPTREGTDADPSFLGAWTRPSRRSCPIPPLAARK